MCELLALSFLTVTTPHSLVRVRNSEVRIDDKHYYAIRAFFPALKVCLPTRD
jgi:hypothetical protein